jgi:hypothetical protein
MLNLWVMSPNKYNQSSFPTSTNWPTKSYRREMDCTGLNAAITYVIYHILVN